ncbi:MAG: Membrane-bound lytic murein transglycosylase D [Chromatiales bacterium USCg_Taylor]|nr:MAG: Membrane-bound lytic murein transglycosylase D [Chromatiales bacterium USCg_Taylor]
MRRGNHRSIIISCTPLFLCGCLAVPQVEDPAQSLPPRTANPGVFDSAYRSGPLDELRARLTARLAQAPLSHEPYDDLWERIRGGFTLPQRAPPSKGPRPGLRQPYLDQLAERARPYLHHIVVELERRAMPTEIVLLPIIESAYRPEAYSPSHAAGIWQLIAGTGKRFGLRQSAWYDGRRDVLASTGAALDYLENLHDLFKGDWLHALAAYNCGEKTVQTAIHRNRRAGRSTSYWSLDLPAETKKFVPKPLAVSSIVAAPAEYNVSLKPIANKPYVSEVEIGAPIRLVRAAALAQMSVTELRRLNPGGIKDTTGPTGPHRLALPVANADILKREIARSVSPPLAVASAPNFLPAVLAVKARRAGVRHTIRAGDSLSLIANQYRVSVRQILRWNRINQQKVLLPGKVLLIYPHRSSA